MIRRYNENDNLELINLFNICFDKKISSINMESSGIILVMVIDNKIIGMCSLDILNDIFKSIRYGYINNLCVHPDYRNKGFANELLAYIENVARENECKYLMLTSNKERIYAHKLYLNNSYEIIDTCVFKKNI